MSTEAVAFFGRVARTGALKPTEKLVLMFLAFKHSNTKKEGLRYSMSEIATGLGIKPSAVHRAMDRLIALGVLRRLPRKARREKSSYRFPEGWDVEGSGAQYLAGIKVVEGAKRKAKARKEKRQSEQRQSGGFVAPECSQSAPGKGFSYSQSVNANNELSYSQSAPKKGLSCSQSVNAYKQVKANGAKNAPKLSEFSDEYLAEFDGWNDEAWRDKMNGGGE